MLQLTRQTPAGQREDGEDQRDRDENGWHAADPAFQPADGRGQHERQQNRERDRHEHGLRPVQDGNHEHTPGERQPRFQGLREGLHRP